MAEIYCCGKKDADGVEIFFLRALAIVLVNVLAVF